MRWRAIITDSESRSGVAPVCPKHDNAWVLDCCPHPHIECWSERIAEIVAGHLSDVEAEIAS